MVSESQVNDGYRCSCGEIFTIKRDFTTHLLRSNRGAEKGLHKSEGRINVETGEITMPPWEQRTKEQKDTSSYAQKKDSPPKTKRSKSETKEREPVRATEVLAQAQQIKVIPRVYTIDYSPVMRAAQEATTTLWGWPDMGLGDLIDTIFHMFFESKGVTLAGYIIHETEEEQAERESMIAQMRAQREKETAEVENGG